MVTNTFQVKKPSLRLGVNVSQQEGSLESLGKLYDLQYGRAAVTELKDGKATATVEKMSRKVANLGYFIQK